MQEITICLNDDLIHFIDRQANGDRSTYLATLISQHQRWSTQQDMIRALQEDISDPAYQAEIALWDCVAGDGLDAER
jgi:hypothetical protein